MNSGQTAGKFQGGDNQQKKTPNPSNYKIVKCKNFDQGNKSI